MSKATAPLPRPLKATVETALVRQFEPEYTYTSLDDPATLAFAESDPVGFVAALPDPVILDEVQRAPKLMRSIKLSVDNDRRLQALIPASSPATLAP